MKRTKIVFLLWILAFLLIWMRHGSPAAALAALFAVFYAIIALIIVLAGGRKLAAEITGSGMAEKEAIMSADLLLRNKARIPVFLAEGKVAVRNLLTGEEQAKDLAVSLWPGQSRTETIEVSEKHCGRIDVTLENVRVFDPLKLFKRTVGVAGAGTGYVAPAIDAVEVPSDYLNTYDMESYQYSQFEKGNDIGEVFGLREYQDGDSPRLIHWKLSAKMDDFVVKIPSFPIENNILLMLDNQLGMGVETTPDQRSGMMELFWSLSASLLERGMPHSVGWYDGEARTFRLREIRNRQEMWNVIPDSLSCGFRNSEHSMIYRYLESLGDRGFNNHFIVTTQEVRDIDRLENYGAVKVFREAE